jgi:hypothetical protein
VLNFKGDYMMRLLFCFLFVSFSAIAGLNNPNQSSFFPCESLGMSPSATSSQNKAALQACITNHANASITTAGTYTSFYGLVATSNTALLVGDGVQILQDTSLGVLPFMVNTNYNAIDTLTANTITQTTGTASLLLSGSAFTVGQYVEIKGDTSNQYNGIHQITAVTNGTGTQTISFVVDAQLTSSSGNLMWSPADANIVIFGKGTIDGGNTPSLSCPIGTQNVPASGLNGMNMIFNRVSGLMLQGITIQNTCNYGVLLGNHFNTVARDLTFYGAKAAIQSEGPFAHTLIDGLKGWTTDDVISFLPGWEVGYTNLDPTGMTPLNYAFNQVAAGSLAANTTYMILSYGTGTVFPGSTGNAYGNMFTTPGSGYAGTAGTPTGYAVPVTAIPGKFSGYDLQIRDIKVTSSYGEGTTLLKLEESVVFGGHADIHISDSSVDRPGPGINIWPRDCSMVNGYYNCSAGAPSNSVDVGTLNDLTLDNVPESIAIIANVGSIVDRNFITKPSSQSSGLLLNTGKSIFGIAGVTVGNLDIENPNMIFNQSVNASDNFLVELGGASSVLGSLKVKDSVLTSTGTSALFAYLFNNGGTVGQATIDGGSCTGQCTILIGSGGLANFNVNNFVYNPTSNGNGYFSDYNSATTYNLSNINFKTNGSASGGGGYNALFAVDTSSTYNISNSQFNQAGYGFKGVSTTGNSPTLNLTNNSYNGNSCNPAFIWGAKDDTWNININNFSLVAGGCFFMNYGNTGTVANINATNLTLGTGSNFWYDIGGLGVAGTINLTVNGKKGAGAISNFAGTETYNYNNPDSSATIDFTKISKTNTGFFAAPSNGSLTMTSGSYPGAGNAFMSNGTHWVQILNNANTY